MRGLTIVVKTTAEQEERLERLLPWHQGYVEKDGSYPHSSLVEKRYAGMPGKHPCKRTG